MERSPVERFRASPLESSGAGRAGAASGSTGLQGGSEVIEVPTVSAGKLKVSRLIIGGNPFSGFSHQHAEKDREMCDYYTVARIKAILRQAEALGINTLVARADNHIIRLVREYRNEGGKMQWFAQTCSELNSLSNAIERAIAGGADAVYIHGGKMDWLMADGDMTPAVKGVQQIRKAGLPVGIAGHRVKVFQWAEEQRLDVDFYMCAYYDPTPRDHDPVHNPNAPESWLREDRDRMTALISTLSKPAFHYKVLAGGNADPKESFEVARRTLRPQDAVVIGFYPKNHPRQMEETIAALFGQEEPNRKPRGKPHRS
jgi:hypothetical protein